MDMYFIIVEPAVPENVGAAARALKTMGFNHLRLVNPCDYLDGAARKMAHASLDVLENARVYDSLSKAVADIDFVIGATAKLRKRVKHDYYTAGEVSDIVTNKGKTIKNAAVVFGRERYGLSTEELVMCDMLSYIPMKGRYPSCNLAQAVMIYAYELSDLNIEKEKKENRKITAGSFRSLQSKVSHILNDIGVSENELLKNRIMERVNIMNVDDIHLLHSISKFYFRK